MGDTDVECRQFHSGNVTDVCAFVNAADDCQIEEGFINYTIFIYCHFSSHLVALGAIVVFIWWCFLFTGLAVTADDFFCPALAVISRTLHLSHNIAGVTFLAFGNGAPDIFSAIAAIGSAKDGEAGLAFGALFGAGMFVTTVVVGTISVMHPFKVMERPFLRDVIFFLGAVFWAFYLMWRKEITIFHSIGFIVLYVVYVLVVVVGRIVYQRHRAETQNKDVPKLDEELVSKEGGTESDSESRPLLVSPSAHLSVQTEAPSPTNVEIQQHQEALFRHAHRERGSNLAEFLYAISPIQREDWTRMRIHTKVYAIFKSPLVLALKLTVPVVDDSEEEMKGWNRPLNCLHCLTGPLFAIFATHLALKTLGGVVPVWVVVVGVGVVVGVLVFCTSATLQPPKYHAIFAYLGFLVAVIWIYSVANEIVNILQTLGIVLNISNAIIGVTLLAWGNSVGDFISDVTMARHGYPRMGISACFGGPLFNVLLGIGIPFTIACLRNGGTFMLQVHLEELFVAGSVMVSLVVSLVLVPLSSFHMSGRYGLLLLLLYLLFLLITLLIETGVIPNHQH